ncbi:MaoC/PaaZ C-terminal domain-containing protein [Paradesulfitobacterium ferrireducens]|uniref:MaoC/PaaZ C-terminal domain-containing protein n=1 Tax=Paradesulfitobacterium ferrireducens TaxID=2816476 RepID=UPI001A8F096A|nr:MaoC/PaaZ C-terminal domain-containing protein [Paradesulfitobacterium ferrireducens]
MSYRTRGLTFDQFSVGDEFHTASRTVTEADVVNFAGISGDYNPLHTNEEWAKENTPFETRIAHGVLIQSIATGLANQLGIFEGTTIAVMEMTSRFVGVVRFGDTIHVVLRVADKKESKKPDRGVANVYIEVLNQRDEPVLQGNWIVMLKRSI